MIERFGLFLAIILHTTSSLNAHSLFKRDLPPSTDSRGSDISSRVSRGSFWLEEDDGYQQDDVEESNEHLRSLLLSSLTDGFKGAGKPPHPHIQSSQYSQSPDDYPHVEHQNFEGHEKEEKDEEDEQHGPGKHEQSEAEEEDEEYREGYEEEYEKRQDKKPEVHLFGPLGPRLPTNAEQLHQQTPHRVDFGSQDLLKSKKDQSNPKPTDANPTIARVERRPAGHSSDFSYIHPEEWSLDNPECSGRLQSPVNLDSDQLVGLDVPSSLIWTGYWNHPQNLTIIDNGHSVELSGSWDKKTAPFISGGPLVGDYLFAQLHFHWGRKDSVGSEHTINNNSFPMEMHMVHYKKDYETLQGALKHDDGLAVVAFLFEIGETSNFGINLLEDSLSRIQNKPKVRVPVKPYPLALLHFIFQEDYASYIGSLTTPPCREIVTWLVSSSPLIISRKQLESFRKISNEWPDKKNYRPQQALNGRNLYYVAH